MMVMYYEFFFRIRSIEPLHKLSMRCVCAVCTIHKIDKKFGMVYGFMYVPGTYICGNHELLGVPKLLVGTGEEQAINVFQLI